LADILKNPLIFGDYQDAKPEDIELEEARFYEDLKDYETIRGLFNKYQEVYNDDHKPMDLVMFNYALEHTSRIHRIIRIPRSNALLVGIGGSGK